MRWQIIEICTAGNWKNFTATPKGKVIKIILKLFYRGKIIVVFKRINPQAHLSHVTEMKCRPLNTDGFKYYSSFL
jgi:hypothetical protein